MRRCSRLAPRQPLSVCALSPASRKEWASTASWKPRPPQTDGLASCFAGLESLGHSVPGYFGCRVSCSQSEAFPPFSVGSANVSKSMTLQLAIKAMHDVTSGHLRFGSRTEHLCLGLLGTLWFTRRRLPQV